MRAAAQIEPVALVVERDRLVLRDGVEQLELEALAHGVEALSRDLARHLLPHEWQVGLHDLGHARLDPPEILGRERLIAKEVVVEAVLDRRTDGHLRAGEQVLDRLGHDMGAVVPDYRQRVGILGPDQPHPGVALDRPVEVAHHAIDLHDQRGAGEALGDG